jgi:multiple sugar transport system permease protein
VDKRLRLLGWNIFLRIVLVTVCATMIVPFLWMVVTSLKTTDQIFTWPPIWIPKPVVWYNYVKATSYFPFFRYLQNTAYITVFIVIGQLITCSMGGYAFARLRFPGREVIFLLYLATMMVPGQVTIIPLYLWFKTLGWLDTYYAIIIPGLFSAFGTFMLRQFFLTLPRELEDAALVDGCSFFWIYSRIILPLSKPALATLAIFTFMGSWNSFFWPLIILNTPEKMTLSVGLALFVGPFDTTFNTLMAASVLVLLPVIIVYILGQKYFVQGVVMSGLKL